jgi:DNA-binding CsgD family transcriptional regulator
MPPRNLIGLSEVRGVWLTRREREVLVLLLEKLQNKEIAARANLSERTVKFHMGALFRKTGAGNRHQLEMWAQGRDLASPFAQDGWELLSDKQQAIAFLVAEGKTLDEIGTSCSVSKTTVTTELRIALASLRLPNREALIIYLTKKNLIGREPIKGEKCETAA